MPDKFYEQAMEELDRLDGTLVPEFVSVQDGYYTKRIEVDPDDIVAEIHAWDSAEPIAYVLPHTVVPCRTPRYRTELIWRRRDA